MISKEQARAIVRATSYRDWDIVVPSMEDMSVAELFASAQTELTNTIPVSFTYEAPNANDGGLTEVRNTLKVAVPLGQTEAEFARALYEVVSIIEEHERREFFRVNRTVLRDRPVDVDLNPYSSRYGARSESSALFHPHGVNRNKLFHDLDQYAEGLRMQTMNGAPMTADAA